MFYLCICCAPPPTFSVGGYVWYDMDRDGVQDPYETGVPSVTVYLAPESGGLMEAITDVLGNYVFGGLFNGNYYIHAAIPQRFSFTLPNVGSNDMVDSDVDQISGVSFAIDGSDVKIDIGLVSYDLTIFKTIRSPPPYIIGDDVIFRLTVTNSGPTNALEGVTITDVLPIGLTFVQKDGDCDWNIADSTCRFSSHISPGQSFFVDITAKITAPGQISNTATVSPSPNDVPERNPNNNIDTVTFTVEEPPPSITNARFSSNYTSTSTKLYFNNTANAVALTPGNNVLATNVTLISENFVTTNLSLTKASSNVIDIDNNGPDAGDVIQYTLLVENTGATIIRNVILNDTSFEFSSLTCVPSPPVNISPGDNVTCIYNHTLTQSEIDS